MPGKITPKQQQILDYIKEEILSKGYPPTVREICEKVGLKSTSSVHSHLETLEKNGYILIFLPALQLFSPAPYYVLLKMDCKFVNYYIFNDNTGYRKTQTDV